MSTNFLRIFAFRLVGIEKRKIYKNKNYTHFDSRKPEYWKYLNSIRNPNWIERHAFYPVIYYKEEKIS